MILNPYETPREQNIRPESQTISFTIRVVRCLVIGVLVWLGLTVAAAGFGGLMSLGAEEVSELPKWNGWSYFTFSVKEGAMFGVVLTWPIALIVFLVAMVRSRRPAT